jgi:death-associated protein kinase
VLQPQWLCTDVLGYLLSHDQQARTKMTGIYSIDEFQQLMVEGDAVPILKVLDELLLCVQCNIDGEVEYEFPCFNSLSRPSGIWEKKSESLAYGGIRITSSHQQINKTFQLNCVFPRVQVQLRHDYLQLRNSGRPNSNDCSLLQWHQGSKYCDGKMECLVICESSKSAIDVVLRGPVGHEKQLYGFMENIFDCVSTVLEDMCPGFHIERQVLSAADLKAHADDVRSYAPRDVLHAHLHNRSELSTGEDRPAEQFVDLLFFGSNTVASLLTFGTELHVSHLSAFARRQLSALLDVPDPMGRDWCLLAVMLGLSNVLPNLDKAPNASFSKTDHILYLWARDGSATVRKLIGKLEELQRADAIEIVMQGIPISAVKSALRDGSASKSHQALKYGPVHKSNKQ